MQDAGCLIPDTGAGFLINNSERLGSWTKFRNPKSAIVKLGFYGWGIIGIDQIPDGDDQDKDNPENNGYNHPVL